MNPTTRSLIAAFCCFFGAASVAGEVDDLTSFTPGTPARASQVNGNFTAVKTAVDDNHRRITALETQLAQLWERLARIVIVAHTRNVDTQWPIGVAPAIVAEISGGGSYPGSYSPQLIHPDGVSYLSVTVQAHVANVSGNAVTCVLENRANAGDWVALARIPVGDSEAFLNASFPSFTAGTAWSFRLLCRTNTGAGTARGEIGVIAGGELAR